MPFERFDEEDVGEPLPPEPFSWVPVIGILGTIFLVALLSVLLGIEPPPPEF